MADLRGRLYYVEEGRVTLDSSGDGSVVITFEAPFVGTPEIKVIKPKGDSGTYSAGSITKTGFTLTVTSSDILSQDVRFPYFAME